MSAEDVQPEINIGLIGHVDHGKTTLTRALSGKWTDTHSEEMKRGITIKLGYAECSIYKNPDEDGPDAYGVKPEDDKEFERKVSLVDAPGHESLMATMLAGTTVMDGAIVLVAADEDVPKAQTKEHIMALEIAGIENVVVVQNKIDLLNDEDLQQNYEDIKDFLSNTKYADAPIIPISAEKKVNIGFLLHALQTHIPTPEHDESLDPKFLITRSFDINRPGYSADDLVGGVIGGGLLQGTLNVGDEIEIRPGRVIQEKNQMSVKPIKTNVTSLSSGNLRLDSARPGGSIGAMTTLDPAVVKSDALVGNLVGKPGTLPPVWKDIKLELHLLERAVGADDEEVDPIKPGEVLLLNANSATTVGQVYELSKNHVHCRLRYPICADDDARVTISRKMGTRFRLIGYGLLKTEDSKTV